MEKPIFIVTIGGGKCLENTQDAHSVLDCLPKDTGNDCQKWFMETDKNDPNLVAFKSVLDGKYLRNQEPNKINWGRIGMGEKQWWILEKGKNPGSCLIRSKECTAGASYLNDFQGHYRDRNKVHMWQMEKPLQFWLDWYLLPADAEFNPKISAAASKSAESTNNQSAKKAKELEAREVAVKKKEEDFADREAALKAQKTDSAAAAQPGNATSDGSAQKAKELEAKEAALEKKEQDLANREAALKQQNADNAANVQATEMASSDAPPASSTADDDSQSVSQLELLKAENENLKLKLRIQDLEQQLKASRKPAASAGSGRPARQKASSNADTDGLGKKDPIVYDCGHIAYPPPRKLRRHVVGMLYEGLDQPIELSSRQKATLARHLHH